MPGEERGANASLQKQMVYQQDFKIKMGKINEKVGTEIDSLDKAIEQLKLKKPSQFGQGGSSTISPPRSLTKRTQKSSKKTPADSHHNYMSVIRSNYDSRGGDFNFGEMVHDINIEEQVHLEQIRNFAMQLMRERKMIDVRDKKRRDSFSTEMGMAFSAKNEVDDFGKTARSKGEDDEDDQTSS